MPRRVLNTILPALVLLVAPQGAGASPHAVSAITADRSGNGKIDTVLVRSKGLRAARRSGCRRVHVRGRRVLRLSAGRTGTTIRITEGRRADTGARLTVHCSGPLRNARVRTSDRARPAPLAVTRVVQGGRQRVVVVWSEPVQLVSRISPLRPLDASASYLPVSDSGLGPGNRTWVETASRPAGVAIVGSRVVDRHGNRGLSGTRQFDSAPGGASPGVTFSTPTPGASGVPDPPPGPTGTSPDPTTGLPPGLPPTGGATGEMPASATDFINSIGVNVHVSYYDTVYGDFVALKNALVNLGIKHIRDGACAQCWEQHRRFRELAAAGIRADLIMSAPGHGENIADLVSMIETKLPGVVDALEGPNEYDTSGAGWADRARAWQTQIYTAAKASPTLHSLPVLAPTMIDGENPRVLGDISDIADCGNWHPYPDGSLPTTALAFAKQRASLNTGSKPLCISEVGWHNATNVPTGYHIPVSEDAAGAYVPRLFLDYFAAGVPRTYLYELADERGEAALRDPEQHFGLVRSDWSPKPAYTNLKNLIALLRTDAQAQPQPFDFSVDGEPPDMRRLLLQQDGKHVVLILWRDQAVWNRQTRAPLAETGARVKVTLKSAVSGAQAFGLASGSTPTDSWSSPTSLTLTVSPRPLVVRFELP